MIRVRLGLLLCSPLLLALPACGDDDDDEETRTAPPSAATATQPAVSPTAAVTPTAPTDGTVAPQNPGAKDPVTTKSSPEPLTTVPLLRDVRMGVHPENGGWERIVFEFQGGLPPAQVKYVMSAAQCGSGQPVTLAGTAILSVRFDQAAQHTDAGQQTFAKNLVPGPGSTVLEAKLSCDFEALLQWELGVKAQQNFKVTTLTNPPRLVIDVKQ